MEITRLGLVNATQKFLLKLPLDDLLKTKDLIISGGKDNVSTEISEDSTNEVLKLKSNQQEADTMIIIHCIAAGNNGATIIVVRSPDTDVFVLPVHLIGINTIPMIYIS